MSYCTADEVRAMIKPDALNMILGDEYIEDADEKQQKITSIGASASLKYALTAVTAIPHASSIG